MKWSLDWRYNIRCLKIICSTDISSKTSFVKVTKLRFRTYALCSKGPCRKCSHVRKVHMFDKLICLKGLYVRKGHMQWRLVTKSLGVATENFEELASTVLSELSITRKLEKTWVTVLQLFQCKNYGLFTISLVHSF